MPAAGAIELVDHNPAGNVLGDIANQHALGGVTDRVAEVRVAVKDQIDREAVDHAAELAVAEQPVFDDRLAAEGGDRRREMRDHYSLVKIALIEGFERSLQARRFPASAHGQALGSAIMHRIRAFIGPESAAGAADTGEPNSLVLE
jgi:hypothetical protein